MEEEKINNQNLQKKEYGIIADSQYLGEQWEPRDFC